MSGILTRKKKKKNQKEDEGRKGAYGVSVSLGPHSVKRETGMGESRGRNFELPIWIVFTSLRGSLHKAQRERENRKGEFSVGGWVLVCRKEGSICA